MYITKGWIVEVDVTKLSKRLKTVLRFDIVGTVYHLVIYMQSNKVHKAILMSKFIQHLC